MHELPQVHVPSAALLPRCLRMPSVQDLFYEDDTVLFIDMHQHEVWPGSGHVNESGRGAGEGFTINVPMPGHPHQRSHAGVLNVWSAAHEFEWDVEWDESVCCSAGAFCMPGLVFKQCMDDFVSTRAAVCILCSSGWERACTDALLLQGWQPVA